MTITISYADASDGGVYCYSTSYADASSGAGTRVLTSDTMATVGQGANVVDPFVVDEAFFRWAYSVTAGEYVVGSYLVFVSYGLTGPSVQRSMVISEHDWGTSLTTDDYQSMYDDQYWLGRVKNIQGFSAGMTARAGLPANTLEGTGDLRVFAYTDRAYLGRTPSGDERNQIRAADYSGTASDPRLVYITVPQSTGFGSMGASAQLSDGTHVCVTRVDAYAAPYATLAHFDGSTVTTIDSNASEVPLSAAASATAQQEVSLVRDAADNVYLLSGAGDTLHARAYLKGSGYAWTRKGLLSGALPGYDADASYINQTASAWFSAGGTAGTVLAFAAHSPGAGSTNMITYALLSCDSLLAGSGTLFTASGSACGGTVLTAPATTDFVAYHNETGTGLDVVSTSATTGWAITYNRAGGISYSRIVLTAGGANISSTTASGNETTTVPKDPSGKARILPVSSTTGALVFGPHIRVRNTSGSSFNLLGSADLSAESVASLPASAALLASPTWDALYSPTENKIWFYYLDVADGHRLMRTGFSLDTMLATREEIEVATGVGAGGTTNHAIRVPRGSVTGHTVRVAVFNSAGTTIYVDDSLNAPPTQPTLTTQPNYDAADAAVFAWAFNDPNPSDTQSAYQLQVDTAAGVNVVDTTKTASAVESHTIAGATLTNGVDYQWRVKVWDVLDVESPWSGYGTFSTSDSGAVTITDPAADGTTIDYASYLISWSVAGATQDQYRVWVTDAGASTSLVDTGWVTSAATTYQVDGMLSDVVYRVEVRIRDTGVDSNLATRIILPTYGHPETPVIVVTATTSGYALVSVTNPAPTGDTLQADHNDILRRASGATTWEVIGAAQVDGAFSDYTAASGVTYEYMARAYAGPTSDSAYTGSATQTCVITLDGVWIHDPVDPDGTARNFPYGRDARSNTVAVEQAGQHYAGRELPVFDYGDAQDETLSLRIDVPSGPTHLGDLAALVAFAAARRVLVVRDNRGRVVSGALSGYSAADQDWGAQVTMTVTSADVMSEVV